MMDAIPPPRGIFETAEGRRLMAAETGEAWRRWGPYLSERQLDRVIGAVKAAV